MPTAEVRAGTSPRTTALAPILASSPMKTGPRILAPAPIRTPAPIVGVPPAAPVPSVTCCRMKQFGPITADGWITIPFGWGIINPPPIF